ncbi:uncharacterized protein C9orf43 homolog [Bombina bombina]|uniref:uncharacterized protein C9orf43 homolog n=1 Tax=Bombina bombina TaxID=8345 RepID=UPI00235A85A9|nr:uncharacterized protein C9orf43 homolog [Bombina bombina]
MSTCKELDETICVTPTCQHPQCWASLRRIERGYPHFRSLRSYSTLSSEDDGGLPILKVITLPNLQPSPVGLDSHHLRISSSETRLAGLNSQALYDQNNESYKCSSDKLFFPGLNSCVESEASIRKLSPMKLQKVEVLDITTSSAVSCDIGRRRHTPLVWVPNSPWKCQQQEQKKDHQEEPSKVRIKDLVFQTFFSEDTKREVLSGLQSKKNKKVPTGGNPHNASIAHSTIKKHSKMPTSFKKEQTEELSNDKQRFSGHNPDKNLLTSPARHDRLLENRRMVLYDTKVRHQQCPARQDTSPLYKLDKKYLQSLDQEEVDLDSIKNQYYLWKKYADQAQLHGKIKVPDHQRTRLQRSHMNKQSPLVFSDFGLFPCDSYSERSYFKEQGPDTSRGSVSCNTAQSSGSNSMSLTSLLEGALLYSPTYIPQESHKTSAATSSIREVQEEEEEFSGPDENLAPSCSVSQMKFTELEQDPLTTDLETEFHNQSAVTPEFIQEDWNFVEPQPIPPPPSPMTTDTQVGD